MSFLRPPRRGPRLAAKALGSMTWTLDIASSTGGLRAIQVLQVDALELGRGPSRMRMRSTPLRKWTCVTSVARCHRNRLWRIARARSTACANRLDVKVDVSRPKGSVPALRGRGVLARCGDDDVPRMLHGRRQTWLTRDEVRHVVQILAMRVSSPGRAMTGRSGGASAAAGRRLLDLGISRSRGGSCRRGAGIGPRRRRPSSSGRARSRSDGRTRGAVGLPWTAPWLLGLGGRRALRPARTPAPAGEERQRALLLEPLGTASWSWLRRWRTGN